MSRLSAWLSLFAIAIQCLVVQTHVHGRIAYAEAAHAASVSAERAALGLGAAVSVSSQDGQGAPAGAQDDSQCLLCQSARASVSVLATPPIFTALLRVSFIAVPLPLAAVLPTAPRSHAWQSRAPPLFLNA